MPLPNGGYSGKEILALGAITTASVLVGILLGVYFMGYLAPRETLQMEAIEAPDCAIDTLRVIGAFSKAGNNKLRDTDRLVEDLALDRFGLHYLYRSLDGYVKSRTEGRRSFPLEEASHLGSTVGEVVALVCREIGTE